MTNVLITGGAGFIGSHLTDRLLERGDDVLVIDNFATARRDTLPSHDNLTLVEDTIADDELVAARCSRSSSPRSSSTPQRRTRIPTPGPRTAGRTPSARPTSCAPRRRPASRASSTSRPRSATGCTRRSSRSRSRHPLDPKDSSYAISKTAGEWYVRLSGLDWISFRLANVYGPRNLSGPLPTFFQRLSEGKPCFVMDTRRDFVFVDDLVGRRDEGDRRRRRVAASTTSRPAPTSRSRSSSTRRSRRWSIELDEDVEVRPRNPDDAPSILLDPSKTERDFDWAARTPLEDGVAKAVDYYREHGVAETFTHLKPVDASEPGRSVTAAACSSSAAPASSARTSSGSSSRTAPSGSLVVDNLLSSERENLPGRPARRAGRGLDRRRRRARLARGRVRRRLPPRDLPREPELDRRTRSRTTRTTCITTLKLYERLKDFRRLRKVVYSASGCTLAPHEVYEGAEAVVGGRPGPARPRQPVPDL